MDFVLRTGVLGWIEADGAALRTLGGDSLWLLRLAAEGWLVPLVEPASANSLGLLQGQSGLQLAVQRELGLAQTLVLQVPTALPVLAQSLLEAVRQPGQRLQALLVGGCVPLAECLLLPWVQLALKPLVLLDEVLSLV